MKVIGKYCAAVVVVSVLSIAGCAAGKYEVEREQQQALVRRFSAQCEKGDKQACSRAAEEKRVLFEVYGCHCKDSMPPGHKEIRAGG